LLWNDPDVGIAWPLTGDEQPTLSAKDIQGKRLGEADLFE
jgi:dTDP-4-dehydrorhamnose 3,5-epimerase